MSTVTEHDVVRFPLSPYQRDIWVAHQRLPDLSQFNLALSQRLSGDVDPALFSDCLARAAHATEAVRLRFGEENGVPFQWVDLRPPEVRTVDLSAEADPRAACERILAEGFDRPFDLEHELPVELALLVEGPSAVHVSLRAHHIATDAWGANLFFDRVRADYAQRVSGGTDTTEPPASPSYLAFSAAADHSGTSEHEEDLTYFRTALDGAEPPLFPRSAPSGARTSSRHSFRIDRALAERIRGQGHSPYAFITAAFALWLSRVHRSDEVNIGVPLLNRRDEAQRRTVGHFANTLPLRVSLTGRPTMGDLVTRVQEGTRELQQHERLPVGDLLRDQPAGAPRTLFDVTVSYVQWPRQRGIPGVITDRGTGGTRAHDADALAVAVAEFDDGGLDVALDYATDVFDADLPCEALARHVHDLVRNGVAHPERPIAEIPMLQPSERRDLIVRRNATSAPFPDDATLHGLFEAQAARTPDRIAVVTAADGDSLTYAELDRRADAVAGALRSEGVRPGDRVAVLLGRGPELLPAILGTLKAGAAYLPIDPEYPEPRIAYLLEDSGAAVALTGEKAPDTPVSTPVLRADALVSGAGAPPATADSTAGPTTGAGDPAYLIYTSGSTGQPKGTVVEHRSAANRLSWMQRRYPIGEGDVLLQKTPVSFDVSVWELFWWGQTGARLALLPPGAERDPRAILEAVDSQGVTVIHFVPSMFGPFLDLLEEEPGLRERLRSMRWVFCSGEALPPVQVNRFNRIFTGTAAPRLVNLYGPTEATVDVSYFDCPTDPNVPVRRVPIGRPIDNIRLYVLDRDGAPQPVGVPGELCIAGVGVARGYHERPELTREKFTDDPFLPGARMYLTGDLARQLADGNIEYLGRMDDQVKIRGNRVELGEVQHALAGLPWVRAAVVDIRPSRSGGDRLVGYYVADSDLDPVEARDRLAEALPEFMIPARFMRIDAVPLTANGKADRRALPDPPDDAAPGGDAPRTATEAVLAQVWAEVLGVGGVGVHDDFFSLGGDSILMLRIRSEAERHGLAVTLGDLARHTTIAELAAAIASAGGREPTPAREPDAFELVAAVDRAALAGARDAYPASRTQLGLLFHSLENEHTAVYHDVFRYSVEVAWDEAAFRCSFERLVARHPALRSSFAVTSFSEPLQVVGADAPGALSVEDLRGASNDDAEARVLAHVEERRFHRYALERAPLFHLRTHLRRSGLDLVLSFHHAILDGWSVASLMRELLQDYLHAMGAEVDPVSAEAPPSPAAHAAEERFALESGAARDYWWEALDGAPLVQLDGFAPNEPPSDSGFLSRRVPLPDGLDARVRRFAQDNGLPVRAVLLAAHCLTLHLLTGQDDIVTGAVTHGRPELPGADRSAGLFLNTVPVRLRPGRRTWLETVREIIDEELRSHPHRRYPLSAIQDDRGGRPVLETAFNYVHLHVLEPLLDLPGLRLTDLRVYEETNFALLVNAQVDPADQSIHLRLDCDGRRYTAAQADLVARSYTDVLRRMVDHPDEEVDPAALAMRDGATAPEPRTAERRQDVVRSFEATARARPDAIALAFDDLRWSYRDLNRAANAVAHRLLALGCAPGHRVGIAMDRSMEMIAAVLGVAKAGAASVPLDVSYPAERLAAMVEQAEPLRVIAHSRHAGLVADVSPVLPVESIRWDAEIPDAAPLPEIDPESTAYILFTSGSTGRPKGVEVPHRTLANLVGWQLSAPSGDVDGATLQFAPLSFDVSFQEIMGTLCGGNTLQLVSEEQRRDPAALLRLIDEADVERVFMPYVALQQLAEAADALDLRPRRLRVVVSAGEQLRVTEEIRRLCSVPDIVLENHYGPTETHVVTCHTMTGDPGLFPDLPPIGRPLPGVGAAVLDTRMRPVPVGAPGELYLYGAHLAHGYRGLPEQTAKSFVMYDGVRHYRTGDTARVLPGGDIVYLGRTDSQVKVRGFRVEPLEVEGAITVLAADQPGIRSAAVVARRRDELDSYLAAFLVGEPELVDLVELRARLAETLPEYLVPSRFHWLSDLPLTPSGKRDDAALRVIPLDEEVLAEYAPPRNGRERVLADIVAELLGRSSVGVHDDFFALGGTSLTAMRLIVTVENRFGNAVPFRAFAAAPTVAQLAGFLDAGAEASVFDPLVPLRTGGGRRPVFLVHPLGGNVLCYLRLAELLPDNRPVYAFQAPGSEPGTDPVATMGGLADIYLERVRQVQPEGPYLIGGWSFGGFVAYEMARRLRDSGERAEPVLLDTISPRWQDFPDEDGVSAPDSTSLLEWFFWELLWADQGGDAPVQGIPAGLTTDAERLDHVAETAAAAGLLPPGGSSATIRRLFGVFRANWDALVSYRPNVTGMDLTLLKAQEPLPEALKPMHGGRTLYRDPVNGWSTATTGRVTVVPVTGDHLTMVADPHVATVAKAIAEIADRLK